MNEYGFRTDFSVVTQQFNVGLDADYGYDSGSGDYEEPDEEDEE